MSKICVFTNLIALVVGPCADGCQWWVIRGSVRRNDERWVVGLQYLEGRVVRDIGEIRSISVGVPALWLVCQAVVQALVAHGFGNGADDDLDTGLRVPVV